MKRFEYVITDALGIHARPAGLLVREARAYPDTVLTLVRGGDEARLTQLMRLMSLGVRQGDRVTVTAEGGREDEAIAAMEAIFRAHL